MGRRNKKKKLDSFMLPLPLAGVVVLVTAVALAYVWLDCRCETLGREIKALERDKELLKRKCLTEEYKWARMKSPREIDKALQKFHIEMAWPKSDQILRMSPAEAREYNPSRQTGLAKVGKNE